MQRAIMLVLICSLAGCITDSVTVEDLKVADARRTTDCQAKGYKPGTKDYQACLAIAQTDRMQRDMWCMGAAGVLTPSCYETYKP